MSKSQWNTVEVPNIKDLQVEDEDGNILEDENNDIQVEQESKDKDFVIADDKDEGAEEKQTKSKKEDDDSKEEEGKKSRASDRIRELVKKNKEAEAKWQEKVAELSRQLAETNKESVTTQQTHLEARIKEAKRAVTAAQEEGKFEEATEHLSTLNELQTKKVVVDSYAEKLSEQKTERKAPKASDEEFDDTEMLGWAVRNRNWWKKDDVKTTLALSLGKKLEKEGLNPSEREYWDTLDEKISDFIGDDDNGDENLQSSGKNEAEKTKKPPQTSSSGASRTSSQGGVFTKGKDGKITARLSPQQKEIAKKLGISEVDFAKSLYKASKSKDEHGYLSTFE